MIQEPFPFVEEEKKETEAMGRPDPDDEDAPSPPGAMALSPSKQRARAAGSAGLSELSKQLRILQAKNEAQSVEINRLERQLRILAELQGISVADLRKALEDACANEAFGELQHRVAKLRAELEAATLAKQRELRGGVDASAPHIANLELRVGELEEVEEKHQREIHHLYEELRHERARATRLEGENAQHKQDAQDYLDRLNKETARANRLESTFQERLQQHQLEQARKMQEMAKLAKEAEAAKNRRSTNDVDGDAAKNHKSPDAHSAGKGRGQGAGDEKNRSSGSLNAIGTNSSDFEGENKKKENTTNAESELFSLLLKEKTDELRAAEERFKKEHEKWMKQLKEKDIEVREAQMNKQVEKDQLNLTIKELKDADSQSELRLAQFKARFNVQDERITDMEQQLSSLYTAFGLIKEEQDVEDMKRAALECNLNEADEEMARQVDDVERKKSQRNLMSPPGSVNAGQPDPWAGATTHLNSDRSASGVPRTIRTPTTVVSTPGMSSPTATAHLVETPTVSVVAQPYDSTPPRTPGTWELLFPEPGSTNTRSFPSPASTSQDGLLIKGVLLVKSKSVMRKWKSRFCKLYLLRNHYQWDMEGKSYTLGTGISKVEFYPNHPLAFAVYTNPFDDMAPIVHAAAPNEEDYHRWMSALTKVTTGGDYDVASIEGVGERRSVAVTPASRQSYQQYSSADSVVSGLSAEEQEAVDLERALRMSQTMK